MSYPLLKIFDTFIRYNKPFCILMKQKTLYWNEILFWEDKEYCD